MFQAAYFVFAGVWRSEQHLHLAEKFCDRDCCGGPGAHVGSPVRASSSVGAPPEAPQDHFHERKFRL